MRDLDKTPYGQFIWFIGVVEETQDDPLQIGRVRVRTFGFHPSKDILPTNELPLAMVLNGGTAKITAGQMVLGFFLDGQDALQPLILGVINGGRSSDGLINTLKNLGGAVSSKIEEAVTAVEEAFTGGSPDKEFWTLVAIAAREAYGNDFQGCCDVAQSIYNRAGSKAYVHKTVSGIVNASGQYEPVFANPSAWKNITDIDSALTAVNTTRGGKLSKSYLIKVAESLTNPQMQKNAAALVEGRTDFLGQGQPAKAMTANGTKVVRNSSGNQFGFSYNYKKNVVYPVPSFVTKDKIPKKV